MGIDMRVYLIRERFLVRKSIACHNFVGRQFEWVDVFDVSVDVCVVVIVMIGLADFREGVGVDVLGIFFHLGVTVM